MRRALGRYASAWAFLAVPGCIGLAQLRQTKAPPWVSMVLAAFLVTGAVAFFVASRSAERATARFAAALGWGFEPHGATISSYHLTRFPFEHVKSGRALYVVSGTWRDYPVQIFRAAERRSAPYLVHWMRLPVSLPTLELVPRSNHHRGADSGDDILLESADFSAAWRVMCQDLRYAHAMVHPRMMEALLALGDAAVPITVDGSNIFSWSVLGKKRTALSPEVFETLAGVFALVPPHVLRAYGVGAPDAVATGPVTAAAATRPVAAAATTAPADAASPGVFLVAKRDRNTLGRLSLLMAFGFFTAPVGVAVGYRALRAVNRGEASNRRTAVAGIVLGYLGTAITVAMIGTAIFVP